MAEQVSQASIDRFIAVAKYDIFALMEDFVSFMQRGAIRIYSYYTGQSDSYPTTSFDELNRIKKELVKTTELFRQHANQLSGYDFWIMLELVEDCLSRLETIDNYSRWLRSAIINGKVGNSASVDYVINQGQTLEQISSDVQADADPQNQWVDIALKNNLTEEGYDVGEGGNILKVRFDSAGGLFLNAVVDNIDSADKTKGLDIDRSLTYVGEDLNTLSYQETIEQSAEILAGLKKGDNPFHPNDGLDEKGVIGTAIAAISFPVIFRQLVNTFSKDDTFTSIAITNITQQIDGVYIDFDIETKAGEVINQGVLV